MRTASAYLITLLVLAQSVMVGCSSGPSIDTSRRYMGPVLRIERGAETFVGVFTAPTGGWNARLDQVRRRFELQEAFVTLTRPPGDALVSQSEVEHHVETRVRFEVDLSVYVRIVDHGAKNSERSYRLAGGTIEIASDDTGLSANLDEGSP